MPVDVVSQLPQLRWSGRPVFCSSLETSGANRLAPRTYPYVDAEAHDDVGRRPINVTATIHFLNSIPQSGGTELFPGQWFTFRETLLIGSKGELEHPDLGIINARVASWRYTISPASISGVSVQVEWTETIDDPDTETIFTAPTADASIAAAAAAEAMADLGITYPDGAPEGDLVSSVNAVFDSGFSAATDFVGEVNKIQGSLDRIEDSLTRAIKAVDAADATARDVIAGAPARWVLQTSIDSLRAILNQAVKSAQSQARIIKTFVTPGSTSLPSLAAQLGASVADLVNLNPDLTSSPTIRKGAQVRYYG